MVASFVADPVLAVASKLSWNGEKQRSMTCPWIPESTGYLFGNLIYSSALVMATFPPPPFHGNANHLELAANIFPSVL